MLSLTVGEIIGDMASQILVVMEVSNIFVPFTANASPENPCEMVAAIKT
ncbi:hypothetical protein VCRA2123O444_520010 [Vibrio crassostreae]|nr:hypothetical protein VCRA2119O432_280007 [Vibrio crassostreae]CAK1954540.1 hypothetical protein VCRA2118O429_270060 [Vibrio crassostreae]CAK1954963.1 hypothetical protein VCRA2113O413_280007 [Vibrio crassostreae]CAK1960661.1 hypothetical protein VCRA2114O423_280062 [Vibrio crassostreae]CAK1961721.1 hypothetical protein VCRA2113O412_290007 [Vibrio crassostreae]